MTRLNVDRTYRNPSELTEYEKQIHAMRQQGVKWQDIADKLGNKKQSVMIRYKTIKEKLAAQ